MRAAFNFSKYFKNLHRNIKSTFYRFSVKPRASLYAYPFFSSLLFGSLIVKHNQLSKCAEYPTSEDLASTGSKNRLVLIRNKSLQGDDIDEFIKGLKANGVDVYEIDLEASSDYIASVYNPCLVRPKDLKFIALNADGDVLEISNEEEHAKEKIKSFFKTIHKIDKFSIQNFYESVGRLKENERIVFTYIPAPEDYKIGTFNKFDTYNKHKAKEVAGLAQKYRQFKNSHLSSTSGFFIIRDPAVAQMFQMSQDDIGEIYTIKMSSIYNNFETNTRMGGRRVQISKIDFSDEEALQAKKDDELKDAMIKRKLYESCVDHVNYFQTQNELDDIRFLLKQLGIKKIFIYYRSNNDENFSNIVTKLTKVKKDMKRDDFCIIATNNLGVLRKEFKIIHDGFTNSFRFIDYSKPFKWQPPEDYTLQIVTSENLQKGDFSHDAESDSDKSAALSFTAPLKSSFEEKPTRKRIKNFLTKALSGETEMYFESGPKTLFYYSKNLVGLLGRRFEDEVLKSESNVIIEFFKPTCPSCAALSVSYEEFAKIVSQIQESIALAEEKSFGDTRYEYNLVSKYKIQNPEKFKNLKVYRYNIYNESPIFPSPAATPLIFLFKKHEKAKPVLIDLVENKINITDTEKVIRNLIRIIDEN